MRTPIVAFGLCLSLAVTAPAGLFGQTPPAPAPAAFCWRGQALPACRNFAIFEVEGSYDVASTMVVDVSLQPTTEYPHPAFGNALNWRLGAMRNVSADWALGGTVNLGFDAWGTLTGVQVRARRWLKPRLSAEFEAGPVHTAINDDVRYGSGFGWRPTLGARLNMGDLFSVSARWQGVYVQAGSDAIFHRDAGFHQGLSIGASAGSTVALAGTGALAAFGLFVGLLLAHSDF